MTRLVSRILSLFLFISGLSLQAQQWAPAGHEFYRYESEAAKIVRVALPDMQQTDILTASQLTPQGADKPLAIRQFVVSSDGQKVLLFTNTRRVWRYETRGDYWVFDRDANKLQQLGKGRPEASLMFAKFSPDGTKAAYVSERNLFVEELSTGKITQLTETNGTPKLINGTFDWVYEEEFDCRDGFRWSPDSRSIAYWQIDANQIRDFLMINTTDSIYPFTIPVEYPKVGEMPSPYKIGVVDIKTKKTRWMDLPGDPRQTYLPRMEWVPNGLQLLAQQLNRKQNESTLFLLDAKTGAATPAYTESDAAWVDLNDREMTDYFKWVDSGKAFIWTSEKDGWRHLYKVARDGQKEELLTKGDYDVIRLVHIDEDRGYVYFMASPTNATQSYLYKVRLDGSSTRMEPVSIDGQLGTHGYNISPDALYALHSFTNHWTRPLREWIRLSDHQAIDPAEAISGKIQQNAPAGHPVEFFQVTTADGIVLDGWLVKPKDFDPGKKYPILFTVYGEPASTTVRDVYGIGSNRLYNGDMSADGYIYASLDGRGTPAPKGRAWRKAIYRKIGVVNIRDQAMGAKAMFERWNWIDTSRVAMSGWSGGGASTLNCLFQYPDIYKTGIAVAAITNQLTYDNIYQERYMGLPQENREDFLAGSPVTHAKNLRGNLLYIHGTADDNVHYQNAEILINELIKNNKYFQMMPYPNRSHGIGEGEGTRDHLRTMYTQFLRTHCPPGGKPR